MKTLKPSSTKRFTKLDLERLTPASPPIHFMYSLTYNIITNYIVEERILHKLTHPLMKVDKILAVAKFDTIQGIILLFLNSFEYTRFWIWVIE